MNQWFVRLSFCAEVVMPTRFIRYAALVVALLGSSSIAFAQETVPDTRTDRWLTNPVDDATFQTYLEFFAYNKSLPFDVVVGETTTEQGIVRQHVTYQSTQQITVTAYLYRQESPTAGSRGGIIYLHGGTGRGKDAGPGVQLGVLMARDGWTVLAIDLWHYGERNTGLLTTYTTQEKTDRLYNEPTTYLTFVTQTVKDVSRGYDYLVQERGVDANRIFLIGHSRGAVLSSIAGAAETRLAGVALLHGGHFGLLVQSHRPAACPANYIGRISPRPLLMFNTTSDTYFLPETTIRPWIRLARDPMEIHWTDTPHRFMSEEDRSTMLAWLRKR